MIVSGFKEMRAFKYSVIAFLITVLALFYVGLPVQHFMYNTVVYVNHPQKKDVNVILTYKTVENATVFITETKTENGVAKFQILPTGRYTVTIPTTLCNNEKKSFAFTFSLGNFQRWEKPEDLDIKINLDTCSASFVAKMVKTWKWGF